MHCVTEQYFYAVSVPCLVRANDIKPFPNHEPQHIGFVVIRVACYELVSPPGCLLDQPIVEL